MPPCGGAPYDERLEQEAELRARLLLGQPQQRKHARLQVGVVDTQRAAADLEAVHHEVVGVGQHRAGIRLEHLQVLVERAA